MFSKSLFHSVRALIILSRLPNETYAGAAMIAREIDAPQNYLGKLLQNLANAGLLVSRKGLNGGFRLAKEPHEISLFDVFQQLDRSSCFYEAGMQCDVCEKNEICEPYQNWKKIKGEYENLLKNTYISSLICECSRQPAEMDNFFAI